MCIDTCPNAFKHEAACIAHLQPPTQTEIGSSQVAIDAKPRLWKHKRPLPTLKGELACNVHNRVAADPRKDVDAQTLGMNFCQLCSYIWNNRGWTQQYIKFRMCESRFALWLILYLASKRNWLCYLRVYDVHPVPTNYILEL